MSKPLMNIALAICLTLPTASWAADTTELKTTLQSSLQRSLERLMIDGALQRMDLESGEMENFYPVENHPMVIRLGDHFVMCSDLKRPDGSSVQVDYYLSAKGKRYALVQTEIGNRKALRALIKAGKAKVLK